METDQVAGGLIRKGKSGGGGGIWVKVKVVF